LGIFGELKLIGIWMVQCRELMFDDWLCCDLCLMKVPMDDDDDDAYVFWSL
jgi:hypothetical protein